MRLLSEYLAEIDKRVEREKDTLARSGAASYDEYCRMCGVIAGLRQAEQMLIELVQSKPSEERN